MKEKKLSPKPIWSAGALRLYHVEILVWAHLWLFSFLSNIQIKPKGYLCLGSPPPLPEQRVKFSASWEFRRFLLWCLFVHACLLVCMYVLCLLICIFSGWQSLCSFYCAGAGGWTPACKALAASAYIRWAISWYFPWVWHLSLAAYP